jgi:lysophospholipase L1-like esterase
MFLRKIYLYLYRFFTSTFAPKKKRNFVYVALGDSSVEGLGATSPDRTYPAIIFAAIKRVYKNALFYNLGRLDSTAADLIEEQLDKAISLAPDLVTISIGINDIRYRRSSIEFEKDLQTILSRLKSETIAEVVINTLPDMSKAPAVPRPVKRISRVLVRRFNVRIARQSEKTNTILVDLFQMTSMYAISHPEMLSEDGFHPSDFGYALWANSVIHHIQHLLKK